MTFVGLSKFTWLIENELLLFFFKKKKRALHIAQLDEEVHDFKAGTNPDAGGHGDASFCVGTRQKVKTNATINVSS